MVDRVRTYLDRWRIMSVVEAKRLQARDVGEDWWTAQAHLESCGHGKAAETTERCCSARISQRWLAVSNQSST